MGDSGDTEGGSRRREVVVPLRLYKTVTVLTTLLAIVGFVGGFMLLDRGTDRASAPISEVDPVLSLVGLALIVAGSAVWVYGTRFRAPGMGTPKDGDDEPRDDG